ncbi:hypothetical protein [Streptomyces sp. NPDC057623]|uniref:hypothetical protein n=1 Tax=Streptomyces sp. NPDC057623 TaxID=3346187 RepID=UPI0036CDE7B0
MAQLSHKDCGHAATPAARAKCRTEGVSRIGGQNIGKFADGEIHELTTEQVREGTGGATVDQFLSCLRTYAWNHALKCSIQKTENGLKFCMGDGPLTWKAPIGRRG